MCGIFGIYNHKDAANITYLGLHALQHRGQESAGISVSDGSTLRSYKEMGLVSDIFTEDVLKRLQGDSAIGHVRYSTHGMSNIKNSQPLDIEYSKGHISIAHNGNLTNAKIIKDELQNHGSIFQTTTDTETILHLMAISRENSTLERLINALYRIEGSYSLVILTGNELIAARDPYGFRPLVLGDLQGSPVVSSESCAFDLVEAQYVREIEPGEILIINQGGMRSVKPFKKVAPRFCIFEYIYFARPDSCVFGKTVYEVRKAFGRELARTAYVDADMVIPIPDSGIVASIGYSQESGIPFELGLIRNHYVGRTFIEPEPSIRNFGVKLKLNSIRDLVRNKKIVVIDDSIVRATTGKKIIKMLRQSGAKEVHFRVSSPPTAFPCFYGIDTPSRKELIASFQETDAINRYLESDTLAYMDINGLKQAISDKEYTFCDACFTGDYPSKFPLDMELEQMELFSEK